MPSPLSSPRLYAFFDTILWIACLNMLWIAFTLLGAGVFGIAPATAAAQILIRKRLRGDAVPLLKVFAKEYATNFIRANAVGIPPLVIAGALTLNWTLFSAGNDFPSQTIAALTLLCGVGLVGTGCYLFPMFARYDLSAFRYALTSSQFAARQLPGTLLLLFVTAACAYSISIIPGLVPFFTIGAWLYATGWLCDRLFTANDKAADPTAASTSV